MHPDIEELRPKLKEILYDCAVEIRATKAALYLYDGAGRFELVTEYGFRGAIRQSADRNDPMIDRCGRGRTPFYINGMAVEPRFSELLYESSTDRLLAAPLYSRGQLVGMIDMRDKAQKQPFEQSDLPKAQNISERLVALFATKNVFGHRFISLSDAQDQGSTSASAAPDAHTRPSNVSAQPPVNQPQVMPQSLPAVIPTAPPAPAAAPARPAPPREAPRVHVPRLATLVLEARTAASHILVPPAQDALTEADVAVVQDVLRAILLIPGVTVAVFSAYGHRGGFQEIAARSTLSDEAMSFLHSKLSVWLTKRGESAGFTRPNVQTPFGTTAPAITAASLQKVFTAPVVVAALRGLYLTVGFAAVPDRAAHEMLAALLTQLQAAVEHSMAHGTLQTLRTRAAEKLLEPDFARYPELRRHSEVVAGRSESLARHLALSAHEVETVRLTALVHDVGMRLLDYERLYRKPDLSNDELAILREHVSVGAVIVEPLLGIEIARSVLCHHERVDGRGYPNDLAGDEIPLASRILQVCDAYTAMTESDTYQPVHTTEAALGIITRGAGSQFDQEIAGRFVEMIRSKR